MTGGHAFPGRLVRITFAILGIGSGVRGMAIAHAVERQGASISSDRVVVLVCYTVAAGLGGVVLFAVAVGLGADPRRVRSKREAWAADWIVPGLILIGVWLVSCIDAVVRLHEGHQGDLFLAKLGCGAIGFTCAVGIGEAAARWKQTPVLPSVGDP